MSITVGSLFAGIGGFDLGLEQAGMEVKWQVEIEPFPIRVLEHHWPDVTRFKDVKDVGKHNLDPIDVLVGGFPCQDVSVAGQRAGLDGERSGLWFEFERIIRELRPHWLVIENVPGLLSSNKGKDFELIVTSLAELGYGVAWRVLDSQYFGVAQRRRRVFIVGSFGRIRGGAGEVLFEPESCGGNPAPSREARHVTSTLLASGAGTSRPAGIGSEADFLVSHALKTRAQGASHDTYIPVGYQGREDLAHALRSHASRADKPSSSTYVAFQSRGGFPAPGKVSPTLDVGKVGEMAVVAPTLSTKNEVASSSTQRRRWMEQSAELFGAVRRLTPLECERLQGFPDGWTDVETIKELRERELYEAWLHGEIEYRPGDKTPDTPRYKAIGNAVTVNVARWIGERIVEVDKRLRS